MLLDDEHNQLIVHLYQNRGTETKKQAKENTSELFR